MERDLQPCPRYGEGIPHGINGGSDLEVSFSTSQCIPVGGDTGSSVRNSCFLQSEHVWTLQGTYCEFQLNCLKVESEGLQLSETVTFLFEEVKNI